MAYSKATLVQQVRYALQDTPAADNLTGAYTSTGLTLTVTDATLYDKGDILEFLADGDTFLVNSASGTTITMLAAGLSWDGSTNADHASGKAFVLRPAFRYLAIVEAIEATILDLWPYGWKTLTDTLTPVSGKLYYDAATSTTSGRDIVDAIQQDTGVSPSLGVIKYGTFKGRYPIKLTRGLPTAVAASTVGYYVPVLHNTTNSIVVRVRAPLTATVSGSNYSDLTGGTMTDCIVYGAASRLLENTEIPRVTQSDVTQGDRSVGPQARLRSGSYFHQRYTLARQTMKRELEATIPPMPVWR